MSAFAQDRDFLEKALPELGEYLLSNEIFWPLGGSLPRLTLGNLLLAQARLEATRASIAPSFRMQIDTTHAKWSVAWEKKAAREIHTRITLWQNFLEDYRSEPPSNFDRFSHEVRNRAILHLLSAQVTEKIQALNMLPDLDARLRLSLVPGQFIWDREFEPSFPQPEYWFLYGTLKSE